jgi:LacI family transcriptional regulator
MKLLPLCWATSRMAGYLQETGHHLEGLVGYDLLPKNVEYLKSGEVNYLIGQRPGLQGYCGVKALCDHVVFKRPVTGVKYMPIDILMKENINFYFEFE